METVRANPKLKNIKNMWELLAKSLPAVALVIISVLHFAEVDSVLDHVMIGISISFAITAVIWWWWIMKFARSLTDITNKSLERFDEIAVELKDLRKEINKKK
jgi:branched-subunit amino acid transport protein AzlD